MSAQAQNRPQFRSGVEVTSIDVTAVDNRGRPISDLKPGEFLVHVDGLPRRVVSADWISRTANTSGRSTAPPSPEGSSSNEAGSGRLILIVIDQPNIRFGGAIGHRAAINKFIDRLQPSDRVGVVNLGVGGKSVSFTTDRVKTKQVVSKSVGGVPYPPSNKTAGEQTFNTLQTLMNDLRSIDGPKTLVLVSQGLLFNAEARPSFAGLARVAAAARTAIYALRLDDRTSNILQKAPDALKEPSTSLGLEPPAGPPTAKREGRGAGSREVPDIPFPAGPAGDRGAEGMEAGGELYAVAATTGGAMFTIVMNADSALARIESELAGYYLLAVESAATDGDGRPHSLKIEIGRPGVTVRAAQYLP
jgi:VWFA-related protein